MSNLGIAQSDLTGASGSGGSGSFNFRGAWSNVTAYAQQDMVTRKGSVWVAAQGNTGVDPYTDNGTNWTLFAEGFNYAGTWLVGTAYNYFDVVTLNNSFYLSVVTGSQTNTGNNPQTDNGTHWALLDQGFNFRGLWSNLTTYQPYDVVTYLSSTYVGLTLNNLGNTPTTSPSNWTLMAAAGQVAPRVTFTFNMPSASITSVQISGNVLTLTATNTFTAQNFGTGQGQLNTFYLTGLTNATFLNGQVITATSVSGTTVIANFTHGNYGPTADTGTVTMSIPNNGVYWTTIQLAPTFALSFVQCGQPNRIELYSNNTSRTNDAGRPATVQPTQFTQHGVITDLSLDGVVASYTSWVMSPLAYGANLQDDTVNVPAALTNISGGAPTTNGFFITFTFTYEETGGVNTPNADEYVLGAKDTVNLPSGVANPTAYFGVATAPATAGSLDDEFPGSSLNISTRWTWANQGTATATVSKSILTLSDTPQGSGSNIIRYIYQIAPATPWQVTTGPLVLTEVVSNFSAGGIVIQDGGTNRAILFGPQFAVVNGGESLVIAQYTDLNTVSSAPWVSTYAFAKSRYLQFKDDGVNHTFYVSEDGINFYQVWQQSRTAWLTTSNRIGLSVYPDANSSAGTSTTLPVQNISVSFDWFRRTL
jgi:hypothetical protein